VSSGKGNCLTRANSAMYKVAHGGEISSGTTLDVRARYFFATDPSEPWVMKLFAKSVMVRIYDARHEIWSSVCADYTLVYCVVGDPCRLDRALRR
jgi:hypothetical protein